MCTFAAAGLVFSAFGTITQFFAQRQQAAAAEAAGKFNAEILRQQAVTVHDIGKVEVARNSLKARQLAGLQAATFAGNRVSLASSLEGDSASQTIQDTRDAAALDAATIRSNAARQALGFLTQANVAEATGSNQAAAFNMQATAGLLQGAGMVAFRWQQYRMDTGEDPFGFSFG